MAGLKWKASLRLLVCQEPGSAVLGNLLPRLDPENPGLSMEKVEETKATQEFDQAEVEC